MGSEQYCLRWNNHQSNLLGVFSQLLKDESLVDVTLVCSEGTSIRAHKVVLSACSSYFQTLFLDHPDRHPIVILKDVRFIELQTLIEYMYKGEVNVQYCQLSELLNTAESLKVKGLVEMTNQNTVLREHEPPTEPERLRSSHLLQKGDQLEASATAAANPSSVARTTTTTPPVTSTATGLKSNSSINTGLPISSSSHSAAVSAPTTHTTNAGSEKSNNSGPESRNASNAKHGVSSHSKNSIGEAGDFSRGSSSSLPPFPLYQPYSTLFSGENSNNRNHVSESLGCGSERCHTTSPVGMHQQQRLMSPTSSSSYLGSGSSSSRLLKTHRDIQNMLHKRPSSADCGSASEAKRSPRTPIGDRSRQLSPLLREKDDLAEEGVDNDEEMEANPMTVEEVAAEEERLRDTKRNIKLLMQNSNRGDEEHRPRSRHHHLESDISNRLTPQPGGSHGGGGASSSSSSSTSIAKSEIGRSITSILGNSTDISGGSGCGGVGGSAPGQATSALPPMQNVPLSLKKEIDYDRPDEKEGGSTTPTAADFRHPSLADLDAAVAAEASALVGGAGSSGGGGGGELGAKRGGGRSGEGGCGIGRPTDGRGSSSVTDSLSPSPSPSVPGSPGTSNNYAIMYPCTYCTASFPNQNKLTRHILSHSLGTLKFREIMHSSHIANLLPPPGSQQHFNAAIMAAAAAAVTQQAHVQHQQRLHSPSSSAMMCPPHLESPIEGKALAELAASGHISPLDMEFAAAAALGGGALSSLHRSGSPGGGGRASSPGSGNSLLMGRAHDGRRDDGSSDGGASAGCSNSGAGSGGGLNIGGSGSNSVVMCKFCGKSFPDVSTLITHLPVHTGDRPFKCEFCGKAFKLRHHMKDHCRVHTGERPFRCSLCGKTFSRSTILKAHEKTHYPKFVRKFLSPSPVDTRDDSPQ